MTSFNLPSTRRGRFPLATSPSVLTYVSDQFWQDADTGRATIPAKIPSYKVLNLAGDYYITKRIKLIAGISNLADEKYYSRVFFDGSIEPAPRRSGYAGASIEF